MVAGGEEKEGVGNVPMDRVSVCDNEKFLHKDGGDGCTAVYNELWTEKMVKMVIFCYIDFPTIQRKENSLLKAAQALPIDRNQVMWKSSRCRHRGEE